MGPASIVRLADWELQRASIDTSALACNNNTRTIINNFENIMVEAKRRVLSVHRCCTSRHCEAGSAVAMEAQH